MRSVRFLHNSLAAVAWTIFAIAAWIPFQAALRSPLTPVWIRISLFLFAVCAAFKLPETLLCVAGLLPVLGIAGVPLGSELRLVDPVVCALLLGACAWVGRRHRRLVSLDGLWQPALLVALVTIFSSVVVDSVGLLRSSGTGGIAYLQRFLLARSVSEIDGWLGMPQSLVLLESFGLMLTATLVVADRGSEFRIRVLRMLAVGAAGASVLNINRILTAAVRSDESLRTFAASLRSLRINIHYGDLNAAGSYFALMLLIGAGLTVRDSHRRGVWAALTLAILTALWLTGSRTALVCSAVALLALALLTRWRPRRRTMTAAVILAVIACSVVAFSVRLFRSDAGEALFLRKELVLAGGRMVATHPVFGVGVGQFYNLSGEFSSPRLRTYYRHENAHNQYVQWAAEFGLIGSIAFGWLFLAVATRARQIRREATRDVAYDALCCGIATFLLTGFAGHPLLTADVAYVFWIAVGLVAADAGSRVGAAATEPHVSLRALVLSTGVIALLAVTLPSRIDAQLTQAVGSGVTYGLGLREQDTDGSFMWPIRDELRIYAPMTATHVEIGLRHSQPGAGDPTPVDVSLDGRPISGFQVRSEWGVYRVPLRMERSRRYHLIELRPSLSRVRSTLWTNGIKIQSNAG